MSHVIIFQNDNGGVAVCIPTGELPIEKVLEKDAPSGAFIVDQGALPNHANDFFDAWVLNGKSVEVSIEKAKGIQKQRLRAERAPLLAAQDVAFQRALEEGKPTDAIVAEKQRLREITNLVDPCTTLDEIRAVHC